MNFDDRRCRHQADTVIRVFNELFAQDYHTLLEGGADEPLYEASAAPAEREHRIRFRLDYFASALHEVAHWCIAGAERRLQEDYGYWYAPDGRSPEQQKLFEQVEVKPQALEWVFSQAAGIRFRLSADNLDGGLSHSDDFRRNVWQQARAYCSDGLPQRAAAFAAALAREYGVEDYLNPENFRLEDI